MNYWLTAHIWQEIKGKKFLLHIFFLLFVPPQSFSQPYLRVVSLKTLWREKKSMIFGCWVSWVLAQHASFQLWNLFGVSCAKSSRTGLTWLLHANWMKIGLCWNYFFNHNFILHPFRTCTVSHMTACAWCLHRCLSSRSFTTRRAKTKTAWSVCDSSTKSYQTSMRYEEADGVKSCCCQHQPAGTFCLFCLFLTLSSSLCLFHAASFKAQVLLGGED